MDNIDKLFYNYMNNEILIDMLNLHIEDVEINNKLSEGKHDDMVYKLKVKIANLEIQKEKVDLALLTLDEEELKFVKLKYFKRYPNKLIAPELNKSTRTMEDMRIKVINKITLAFNGGWDVEKTV